jgi:hypothetical protein
MKASGMKTFCVSPFRSEASFNAITITSVITRAGAWISANRYNKGGEFCGSVAKLRPNRRLFRVIKKT